MRRVPSVVAIALAVAPLVRLGALTDAEGRFEVALRYRLRCVELAREPT